METLDTPFGRFIVSEDIPEGTILFLPPITLNRYLNMSTGEVKEYFNYDPKTGGIISNIKSNP